MSSVEISWYILVIMYLGDILFTISGALVAGKHRMDVLGYVLVGTITGIGGGTIRDLLLGKTVWWTQDPKELLLCVSTSLITFFLIKRDVSLKRAWIWADALGLSAFGIVGCRIALDFGSPFPIAVFMGMITATGGGVVRDIITNQQPVIMKCGELYATAALAGSLTYAFLESSSLAEGIPEVISFLVAFILRAAGVVFEIRLGPPGEFISLGKLQDTTEEQVRDTDLEP